MHAVGHDRRPIFYRTTNLQNKIGKTTLKRMSVLRIP
jgi:hypothetical protein